MGQNEDEGGEPTLPMGGPWGGRPQRKQVKPIWNTSDGESDGESGQDGFDQSWTKAGGPFMKTPSANKLILMMGFDDVANGDSKDKKFDHLKEIPNGDVDASTLMNDFANNASKEKKMDQDSGVFKEKFVFSGPGDKFMLDGLKRK